MNSRIMMLLAALLLIAATLAGYLGYRTTTEAREQAEAERLKAVAAQQAASTGALNRTQVVVARQDIPAFKVLTAEDLDVDTLRRQPPNTYRQVADVLGQAPQVALAAGAILTRADLQPGSDIARLLHDGERAVAIPIDEVVGGGGFVQPGDVVDILLYLRSDGGARDSAQVVMESLRVLGFGAEIISPAGGAMTPEQKSGLQAERARAKTAVLAVPEKDVTRLMLGSSLGVLRLAIRPPQRRQEATPAVASGKTPVHLVTSTALRAGSLAPVAPVAGPARTASAAVPRARPAASRPPAAPNVIIYRGLQTQEAK